MEDYKNKYEDLLDTIKDLYPNLTKYQQEKLQGVCPELAESEDEKIRKALLEHIKGITSWGYFLGISREQMISWLEKQKPTEKVNAEDCEIEGINTAIDILETTLGKVEGYQSDDGILEHKAAIVAVRKMKIQKPAIKPIFEVGDVMRTIDEAAKNVTEGLPVVVSIDKEYYKCNNELIAIKDQYDYEYPPKNKQQKTLEWSEEDERMLNQLILRMDGHHYKYEILQTMKRWLQERLKFLRPQLNEELIEKSVEWLKNKAANYVVCNESEFHHYAFKTLIEDFKQAMKEE